MWNPSLYNKFKVERFAPFYDLLKLVVKKPNMRVIDLGCGTGELTRKLANSLPGADVLGIDSSPEMLQESEPFKNEHVRFECHAMQNAVEVQKKWDLVFSNAAIHWVDNHETFLPQVTATIKEGGQLAVQVPSNHDHFVLQTLNTVALKEPFKTAMKGWTRTSPVLKIEAYARILFECGGTDITVYEKIYPHVLENSDALLEFTSGTALIPFMQKLSTELKQGFMDEYRMLLRNEFPGSPIFYPFKRTLMSAVF